MKTSLTGAMGLCLWLAAIPAVAQVPNPPKNAGKPPPVAAPVAPLPAPQAPAANPAELTYQAIVEEQKRRDREAEAERERDDL